MVYLYSVDLSTVTLCIAFGTTQFESQFGGREKAFPRMREAATRLQHLFKDAMPSRYSLVPIDLAAGGTDFISHTNNRLSVRSRRIG